MIFPDLGQSLDYKKILGDVLILKLLLVHKRLGFALMLMEVQYRLLFHFQVF